MLNNQSSKRYITDHFLTLSASAPSIPQRVHIEELITLFKKLSGEVHAAVKLTCIRT